MRTSDTWGRVHDRFLASSLLFFFQNGQGRTIIHRTPAARRENCRNSKVRPMRKVRLGLLLRIRGRPVSRIDEPVLRVHSGAQFRNVQYFLLTYALSSIFLLFHALAFVLAYLGSLLATYVMCALNRRRCQCPTHIWLHVGQVLSGANTFYIACLENARA